MSAADEEARPASLDAAWAAYHEGIASLRAELHAMPIARSAADHAAADRWLLQAQSAAHNLVLAPDPLRPHFLLHTLFEPGIYSWLLPNPDFLYRYAFVDGRGTYRIEGVRRNAHFIDLQTISGFWGDPDMKLMASYDLGELLRDAGDAGTDDGGTRVDLHVGPEAPADGRPWIRTEPGSARNTLILREAFYDWSAEERSSLSIEATAETRAAAAQGPGAPVPDEGETIRRLGAALRMIRFCHETFSGQLTANVVEAVGTNRFLLLDTSRDEDAANPSAGYVPVVFDLAPGECLVLDFEVPRASYWGLQAGDVWWQAAEYVDHASSLNGFEAEADPDGRVRVVLGPDEPGVANWLDTAGLTRGVALLRWYHATHHPVPEATRVPVAELASVLPETTHRITGDERQRRLAARRRAIGRRYFD